MKTRLVTIMCAAVIGLAAFSAQALAQQKTKKACEDEWRANRAENETKHTLMKDYVPNCLAASKTARTAAPAAPAAAPAARAPVAPAARPAAPAAAATTGANQF